MLGQDALARPHTTLITAFAAWKLFLLAIAAGSSLVGDAYDTSASLALELPHPGIATATTTLLTRLSSWDAIYFVAQARRGYMFEQEWAFASGLPTVASWLVRGLIALGIGNETSGAAAGSRRLLLEPLAGVLTSNAAHLLSALALYHLGWIVWREGDGEGEREGKKKRVPVALAAALLHIVSPAGLFLSAPNAESGFALLTFAGYWALAKGIGTHNEQQPLRRDVYRLLAGVLFGLATTFRSNGLLNGIPFAWAFLQAAVTGLPRHPAAAVRELAILGVGGACVAAGSVVPQVVAYLRFCRAPAPGAGWLGVPSADSRPWCNGLPPSIYTFVQAHYWDVGFLRYWKLSNVPLFLLAAPMLFVLLRSGLVFLTPGGQHQHQQLPSPNRMATLVQCMAAAQVLLAGLAITNYHVQVITRLSSGCPLWYWWLARQLGSRQDSGLGNGIVVFMVMYASIQGVLFASFLPPA